MRGADPEETPEELEAALEAFDRGEVEEALTLLEEVDPGVGERWTTTAHARVELGDLAGAEDALARARALLGTAPEVHWAEGRVRLAQWRLAEARAAFGHLDVEREGAPLLENLALLADLSGDLRAADQLYRRAAKLDPEGSPLPPRLSPENFEASVARAAEALPPEFRRALEETAVVIDPMPTAQVVGAPESGHPPDILGLFVGPVLSERAHSAPDELPPTIFLFQRNLERAARSKGELVREIRTTLYHELGHALGFDEEGVDALGLA